MKDKKAMAPELLIGGLIIFVLLLVVIFAFVQPGGGLLDSILDLFGINKCPSPVSLADDLEKELSADSLKKANETYAEFQKCYPRLEPREINDKIPENYLVDLGIKKA